MSSPPDVLHVLIVLDEGIWVAQCVERDLVTQAASLGGLVIAVHRMLLAHVTSCIEVQLDPWGEESPQSKADQPRRQLEFDHSPMDLTPRFELTQQAAWMKPWERWGYPPPQLVFRIAA